MGRKKTPPTSVAKCCIGPCNKWSILIYARSYGICEKHWNTYCDGKFKYKHFKDLREYLGLPPIRKPKGYENVPDKICDEIFAYHHYVEIDVEHNLPVLVDEEYTLWNGPSQSVESIVDGKCLDHCIKWSGIKEDPLDLFVEIDGQTIPLLRGSGNGVRFTSEANIENTIMKLQDILNESEDFSGLESKISKKFKNSKLWNVVECEAALRKATNGRV